MDSFSKLSAIQLRKLEEYLEQNTYLTVEAIHAYVEEKNDVSYSPNLNLIERLWKFMKKQVLYNNYYEKFDVFKKTTLEFFENIQLYKTELDSLLTNNFQVLSAE